MKQSARLVSVTRPSLRLDDATEMTPEALIAYCARVSSPTQENPSYEKLLRYCAKHKHWSIFEMADMTVEITTSRGIAPQILRHRSFSFQEFCIAGDSKISCITATGKIQRRTIKSLYKLQHDTRWGRLVRVYDEASKTLVPAKVKEVFFTGRKPLYRVKLANGKSIVSTAQHKFLTKSGFSELGKMSVGDVVGCNGVPVHQDREWLEATKKSCVEDGSGLIGISLKSGVSSHTIRKWLKKHDLQFTKTEVSSYTKIWNRSLPTTEQPRFGKTVSDETREKMSDSARKGNLCQLFVDGRSAKRSWRQQVFDWQYKYKNAILKRDNEQCRSCGDTNNLEIDHIIPVKEDPTVAFSLANLQVLCQPCHRKKSASEAKQTVSWSKIEKIEFVGEGETYDLEVEHVSHNYIANGIVTHNSQRYAEAQDYIEYAPRRQDNKNRQNSFDDLPDSVHATWNEYVKQVVSLTHSYYKELLKMGVAKECARFLLPQNTMTKLYMKGSVRSWIHYLEVRRHPSAQKEHRELADMIWGVFKEQFPTVARAVEEEEAPQPAGPTSPKPGISELVKTAIKKIT